ncbi:MAG: dTMP kinase [Candidatus Nanoarchaeia archaeon]
MKRGKLIVIEGSDGSGKSTQAKKLVEKLHEQDIKAEPLKFPDYSSPTGDIVARYLGKHGYRQEFGPSNDIDPMIASTWYALDRWAKKPEIESKLSAGIWLISDRYVESNLGHQGGKVLSFLDLLNEFRKEETSQRGDKLTIAKRLESIGGFEGFVKWLTDLEYNHFGIPSADKVIYLHRDNKTGNQLRKSRGEAGDGHESSSTHMAYAEQAYEKLSDMLEWISIDCIYQGKMRKQEDIAEEIWENITSDLQN